MSFETPAADIFSTHNDVFFNEGLLDKALGGVVDESTHKEITFRVREAIAEISAAKHLAQQAEPEIEP